MAELSAGGSKLLAYWGDIQAAVAQRVGTADLWNSVRAAAAAEGYDLSGVSAIDMGQLRSLAAANRNAAEAFAAASPTQEITGAMIGSDLSARNLVQQSMSPKWLVRFEHTTISDGLPETQWRTSLYEGFLPPTKAQLQQTTELDGAALAEDYNVEHVGVGNMIISTI